MFPFDEPVLLMEKRVLVEKFGLSYIYIYIHIYIL